MAQGVYTEAAVAFVCAEIENQTQAFQLTQKENTELAALSEQLPVELETLQAQLETEKENYENARSAVEEAELARERKKRHLREGHELYESRLALKIQTSKKDGRPAITPAFVVCLQARDLSPYAPGHPFTM